MIISGYLKPRSHNYLDVTGHRPYAHAYNNAAINPEPRSRNQPSRTRFYDNAMSGWASSLPLYPQLRKTKRPQGSSSAFQMTEERLPTGHYPGGFNPMYTQLQVPRADRAPQRHSRFISRADMRIKPYKGMLMHYY